MNFLKNINSDNICVKSYKKKKIVSLVVLGISFVMLNLSLIQVYAASDTSDELVGSLNGTQLVASTNSLVKAVASPQKVMLNNQGVEMEAYNINGSNYFKLRDIAYILNGTQDKFEVTWDNAKQQINLVDGKAYTAVGGEMSGSASTQYASKSTAGVLKDSSSIKLDGYFIHGNNFYKLRDICDKFDVEVEYVYSASGGTIFLTAETGETGTPSTPVAQGDYEIIPGGVDPMSLSWSNTTRGVGLYASAPEYASGEAPVVWSGTNTYSKGRIGKVAWISNYGVQVQSYVVEGLSLGTAGEEGYEGVEEDVAYMINDAINYFKIPDAGKMTGDEACQWLLTYGKGFTKAVEEHVGVQVAIGVICEQAGDGSDEMIAKVNADLELSTMAVYIGNHFGCGATTRY